MPPQIVKTEALHKVAIIAVRLAIVPIVRRAPAVPAARESPRETEADSGTDKRDQRSKQDRTESYSLHMIPF